MKLPTLVFLVSICIASASDPVFDDVDYSQPGKYIEIKGSLGTLNRIEAVAIELEGDSQLKTIQNVLEWMDLNLTYEGSCAYSWRNFDDVLDEKRFGGCADQGIFCGVLLKELGIPVIWVKTMDVPWIHDFKKGRPFSAWSGHVFLEVFVNDRWMLLNPGAKTIYKDYKPETRILPGNRFAYHKGDDPKNMIMSLQWDDWKEQTTAYFSNLDDSLLPVDPSGRTLLKDNQAFVVGNSPYYQKLSDMARDNGYSVTKAFNADYDRYLPAAKGHMLLIETHSGKPIVSQDILEKHFPGAFDGVRKTGGQVTMQDTQIIFFDLDDSSSRLTVRAEEANE